jgi:hypothetical protein
VRHLQAQLQISPACALLSSVAIVEQKYPPFRWAKGVTVEHHGGVLRVSGQSPWGKLGEPSLDLLQEYRKAPKNWSKKHSGKDSPHVRFANADSDEKLLVFVKQFGPVVVCDFEEGGPPSSTSYPTLLASQDLQELRKERIAIDAAIRLISVLASSEGSDKSLALECILAIADAVRDWPRQRDRERELRSKNWNGKPDWSFDRENLDRVEECVRAAQWKPRRGKLDAASIFGNAGDHILQGHRILCELVNAFKPRMYRWANRTLEGPDYDLRYGVRPLLYFLLRRAYLEKDSVGICANERCRELFEIEKAGQRFCDPECSRLQRQREYWASIGSKQRQKRRRTKVAKKVRTKDAKS